MAEVKKLDLSKFKTATFYARGGSDKIREALFALDPKAKGWRRVDETGQFLFSVTAESIAEMCKRGWHRSRATVKRALVAEAAKDVRRAERRLREEKRQLAKVGRL